MEYLPSKHRGKMTVSSDGHGPSQGPGESSTEVAQVACGSVCACVVGEDAQRLLSVIYHLSSKANHTEFKGH